MPCPPCTRRTGLPTDQGFGLEFPCMAAVLADTAEELRRELSDLIVRRLRIGLRAFLAGVVLFVVADHSLMAATPRWADMLNVVLIALAAIALGFSRRPAFRAHAVPFGLLIVAMICGSRALAGIWTGDLVPTAIVCLVVALTAGASLPWGAWPQLASVAIAGLAIASNAYLISGTSGHERSRAEALPRPLRRRVRPPELRGADDGAHPDDALRAVRARLSGRARASRELDTERGWR